MKKLNEWKDQKNNENEGVLKELSYRNKIIYAVLIITAFAIGFLVWQKIKFPNSYNEIRPMMDEAAKFDRDASDASKAYQPIDAQIGEDAYFNAVESDYNSTINEQQIAIQNMKDLDAEVARRGGITNLEELQTLKQTPTNPDDAKAVEKEFKYREGLQ